MSQAMRRVFGMSASHASGSIRLTEAEVAAVRSRSGAACTPDVRIVTAVVGGKRVGYGLIDNVRGKSQLITYALMVDQNLVVRDLEVLVYREPYGGEVGYEMFRRQFRGKSPGDNIRIGGGIRNISGATISSNAVANGTRKLLAVLQVLREGGRLP